MRIAGNYTFHASREEVWSALNDPEVLARTIPGCQRLEQVGENLYDTTLKVGLQAVRGTYSGRVEIFEQQAPTHYKIQVDGKGSNGFLKGAGSVDLREEGDTTILDYGGEAQVGGTIASVGQRLLDGAAKTLITQSLKALANQVELRRSGYDPNHHRPEATAAAPAPQPAAADQPPAPQAAAADQPPAAQPAAGPPGAALTTATERRSIVLPEQDRLTEADVARGIIEDFMKERPWFPWVIVAFLLGVILGRRK